MLAIIIVFVCINCLYGAYWEKKTIIPAGFNSDGNEEYHFFKDIWPDFAEDARKQADAYWNKNGNTLQGFRMDFEKYTGMKGADDINYEEMIDRTFEEIEKLPIDKQTSLLGTVNEIITKRSKTYYEHYGNIKNSKELMNNMQHDKILKKWKDFKEKLEQVIQERKGERKRKQKETQEEEQKKNEEYWEKFDKMREEEEKTKKKLEEEKKQQKETEKDLRKIKKQQKKLKQQQLELKETKEELNNQEEMKQQSQEQQEEKSENILNRMKKKAGDWKLWLSQNSRKLLDKLKTLFSSGNETPQSVLQEADSSGWINWIKTRLHMNPVFDKNIKR